MLVVGVATFIALSIIAVSSHYSSEVRGTINTNQIDQISKEIVDTAESIYYYGAPTKTTIKIYMPGGVNSVNLNSLDPADPTDVAYEISFKVQTRMGESDIFYLSPIPLKGSIKTSEGYQYVSVEANEGYVFINST